MRLVVALGLTIGLTAGCGVSVSPEQKTQQCRDFAAQVRPAGLGAPQPDRTQVTRVADTLDRYINGVGDPSAHDAAIAVHDSLHRLVVAYDSADPVKVDAALAAARRDATSMAATCGLGSGDFLGT